MIRAKLWLCSALVLFGCATLAGEAGDNDAPRPNAGAGPFRALRSDEIAGTAPYVLKQKLTDFQQATALALENGSGPGEVAIYVMARIATRLGVYRFVAPDGRSFAKDPDPTTPVLEVGDAWEGSAIDAPDVVRVGSDWVLYYAADGGVGAAVSSDGKAFQKLPGPVLGTSGAAAWEGGKAPRGPSVVALATDDYRLFYEADGRIGEARSSDGKSWERVGDSAVLEAAASGSGDPPFDGASVEDPDAHVAIGPEGRVVTRVYYTGRASDGSSAIGMAARFGGSGPLTRAVAPAFTSSRNPYAPSVVAFGSVSFLYLTERAGIDSASDYPAIAAGIAPATLSVPLK